MRSPVLRLAVCVLTGAATVLMTAPAAIAVPAHDPEAQLSAASSAPHDAPPSTRPHGRKLS